MYSFAKFFSVVLTLLAFNLSVPVFHASAGQTEAPAGVNAAPEKAAKAAKASKSEEGGCEKCHGKKTHECEKCHHKKCRDCNGCGEKCKDCPGCKEHHKDKKEGEERAHCNFVLRIKKINP